MHLHRIDGIVGNPWLGHPLVKQFRIGAYPVMRPRGVCLVSLPPQRSLHDERGAGGRLEEEGGEQITDFRNGWHQGVHCGEAPVAMSELDSFRLRHAMLRMLADNLARKAAACCSASPFDPPKSQKINMLPRRSASNLRVCGRPRRRKRGRQRRFRPEGREFLEDEPQVIVSAFVPSDGADEDPELWPGVPARSFPGIAHALLDPNEGRIDRQASPMLPTGALTSPRVAWSVGWGAVPGCC